MHGLFSNFLDIIMQKHDKKIWKLARFPFKYCTVLCVLNENASRDVTNENSFWRINNSREEGMEGKGEEKRMSFGLSGKKCWKTKEVRKCVWAMPWWFVSILNRVSLMIVDFGYSLTNYCEGNVKTYKLNHTFVWIKWRN